MRLPNGMMPRRFPGLARLLGIERFDGAAKLGQIGADAGVLVDRLDRPVEEAVRGAGGFGDLLAAHRGQLVDLLAELRAVGIERGELVDELADALVELARLLALERDEAGRLGGSDRLKRFRRVQVQLRLGRGLGRGRRVGGHAQNPFSALVRRGGEPVNAARLSKCIIVLRQDETRRARRTW